MAPLTSLLASRDGGFSVPINTVGNKMSIIVISTYLFLSWVAVALRLWTRTKIVKIFGWDDAVTILTLLFFSVYCGLTIYASGYNIGKTSVPSSMINVVIEILINTEYFYILTMISLKISLGLFFLRFTIQRWQRRLVYGLMALSTLWGTAFFFLTVFECPPPVTPLRYITQKLEGKCAPNARVLGTTYAHGAVNTITDLAMAMIPFLLLKDSPMKLRNKIPVYCILVLATTGGIASIIRFWYIKPLVTSFPNFFAKINDLAAWTAIEPGTGIIAGSLATMRKLFDWLRDHISSLSRSIFSPRTIGDSNERSSRQYKSLERPLPSAQHQPPSYIYDQSSSAKCGSDVQLDMLETKEFATVSVIEHHDDVSV